MSKTNSQASFRGGMSKKKYAIILPVIIAVMIGHFVIQLSFIEDENKRVVETLAKTEPAFEENTQPATQINENQHQETEIAKTDIVLSPKPLESHRNAVKIIQKESRRQMEAAPVRKSVKKESNQLSKAERLRRAEKILTGF